MKNLMMMVLVLGGSILADSSVAKADHRWHGGRGSSFSVNFGNGYNNFSYSQGHPRGLYGYGQPYGGYYSHPVVPVYRSYPVYSVPVYGGGYGGYGGFGGYGGHHRHCH